MKRITILLLGLCLLCAQALGEAYTYGGSGNDVLGELAVSGDGRMVMTGYTDSADGTLAARTKTGRSGWALCVDGGGNVLWSFCSRLGNHDTMSSPVFHEDGSVTVILEAETDAGMEMELIRLSRDGAVLARRTMDRTGGEAKYIDVPAQRFDGGYVLRRMREDASVLDCTLYDWDGQAVRELEGENGSILAAAQAHVIRMSGGTGTLWAQDGQGGERRLADVLSAGPDGLLQERYDSLISLADGGAAGCGWVLTQGENGSVRKGLFTRWDAQGDRVFEIWMEIGRLWSLVRTEEGFAASCYPNETQENVFDSECAWELVRFDERGVVCGREPLGTGAAPYSGGCALALLPDGSIAALQNVQDGEMGYRDVRLTIVPAK